MGKTLSAETEFRSFK